MSRPVLSLCVICGDSGVETLARMLKSVLHRPSGPLVQEVVIGFNGGDSAPFFAALNEVIGGFTQNFIERDCSINFGTDGAHETVHFHPFRQTWTDDFAAARNEVSAKAYGIWHMYLDTDDIIPAPEDATVTKSLVDADAEEAPSMTMSEYLLKLPPAVNCIRAPYHYVLGGSDETLQVLTRRRIVRWADGWAWANRIHEDVLPLPGNAERWVGNSGFVIKHYPSEKIEKKLQRNTRIVNLVAKDLEERNVPLDHRTLYNIGSLALQDGDFKRADQFLTRAILGADGTGELAESLHYRHLLARNYVMQGRMLDAIGTGMEQLSGDPGSPEGYLTLVDVYYRRAEWAKCVRWYELLAALPIPPGLVTDKPVERTAWPAAWAAEAYANLGNFDRAIECGKLAVKAGPVDAWSKAALELVTTMKRDGEAIAAARVLVDYHLKRQDLDRAEEAMRSAPISETDYLRDFRSAIDALANEDLPSIQFDIEASNDVDGVVTVEIDLDTYNHNSTSARALAAGHGRLLSQVPVDGRCKLVIDTLDTPRPEKITIFAPAFNEMWEPDWAETRGIGGSEEAIIYLSRALAKKNYEVVVYGPAPQKWATQTIDGVEWRRLRDFAWGDDHGILIAHRAPWILQHQPNARKIFVWHHDHSYGPGEWVKEQALRCEHLFVSEWQRTCLESQIDGVTLNGAVIGNGIPDEQCIALTNEIENVRNVKRVVYASQPVRGLSRLLSIWPDVLAKVPDAELHLYYGKHTNQVAARMNPAIRAELELCDRLLKSTQRVVDHDRISQPELMNEMRKAGIWAYPCVFPEVSCIAGMRANAAGLTPVFLGWGSALAETQVERKYMVAEKWEEGGKEKFLSHLLDKLVSHDWKDERDRLRERALEFHSWNVVAERFLTAIAHAAQRKVGT